MALKTLSGLEWLPSRGWNVPVSAGHHKAGDEIRETVSAHLCLPESLSVIVATFTKQKVELGHFFHF